MRETSSTYLLQNSSTSLDVENKMIEDLLRKYKYTFNYKVGPAYDLTYLADKTSIPIGDIDFVTTCLNKVWGIEKENPIEVPEYLRTDEFLKRDYKLVTWNKIPRSGKFFLKDVSLLKKFGDIVDATYIDIDELFNYVPKNELDSTLVLDKSHLFQISTPYYIQSEYRVYVLGGEIEHISCYNGDCTVLPDIELIKKAVNLINYNEKWLRSYTIDVMVGKQGTAIIEVHNFASVGLYSTLWGISLIYAYRDGIDYLLNDNKALKI